MEVPGACAAQFSGETGALFVKAVSAVVAAHCAITDHLDWPLDEAPSIFSSGGERYDFIIVGAGTAGSLVANRLGQVPNWNILLIEAGDDPTFDSQVPAFLFSNQDTEQDWQHKTEQNSRNCLSSANGECKWAKGKGMGGSTSINAMLYVRGNKADYDEWEAAGNPGWGYESILKYFQKIENCSASCNGEHHSKPGELHVELYGGPQNPWKDVIGKAWIELGYEYNIDINGKSQIGLSNAHGTVKNGMRYNIAKRLLSDASKRGNLHVMKNTLVTKINFHPISKKVTGVEVQNKNGDKMILKAKKEVILSAGTIKSPQLLMLSGIGPKAHLESFGIPVILDLAVGENLQDHPIFPVFLQMPESLSINYGQEDLVFYILQYMLTREGPFRGIGITDLLGFVDTKDNSDVPDIEFHHIYFSKEDNIILPAYRSATGYVDEFWMMLGKINKNNDVVGMYPTLIHPKSRGKILLKSENPSQNPIIEPGYFENEEDLDTMLRGIHFVFKLLDTPTFRNIGVKVPEFTLSKCIAEFGSNEFWRCWIRHVGSTIYHPVGTVKMGPLSDHGVVDSELKLHGVEGLRVIDASIMPTVPRGNTMAATLVVAEKGAEMLKNSWLDKRNEKNEL